MAQWAPADRADANAAKWKDPGLDRRLAHHFDNRAYIDVPIEIG